MQRMTSPTPRKRSSALDKITPEELRDYHERRLSTAELSERYGVSAKWVRTSLPKRIEVRTQKMRSELRRTRQEYRYLLAAKVANKEMSAEEAANQSHCSKRSMHRYVKQLRDAPKPTEAAPNNSNYPVRWVKSNA